MMYQYGNDKIIWLLNRQACTLQVEDAQSREAPVQRLADSIAGPFAYTIMAASATTFFFWYIRQLIFTNSSRWNIF
jgi:cation transport ATPase